MIDNAFCSATCPLFQKVCRNHTGGAQKHRHNPPHARGMRTPRTRAMRARRNGMPVCLFAARAVTAYAKASRRCPFSRRRPVHIQRCVEICARARASSRAVFPFHVATTRIAAYAITRATAKNATSAGTAARAHAVNAHVGGRQLFFTNVLAAKVIVCQTPGTSGTSHVG